MTHRFTRTYSISFTNGAVAVSCGDSFTWKKIALVTGYDKVKFTETGYNLMHAEFCLAMTVHDQMHSELTKRLTQYEHFDFQVEKAGTFLASCVNPAHMKNNPALVKCICTVARELAEAIAEHEYTALVHEFGQSVEDAFSETVS